MGLGREESKHISCQYEGRENDCPKDCKKCAISIKTDGDIALSENKLDLAIRQYKRAVFVEPKFAEAWVNMGNAYGMRSEYNNAIPAFNKAITIDPTYGKALFGKAITLRNLGMLDEAMSVANSILEMYDDESVKEFKKGLLDAGVKDKGIIIDANKAKAALSGKATEIMQDNNLFNEKGVAEIIPEIYQAEIFTKKVLEYCKKKYASLGIDKVHGECVITSFYGSICATLFYLKNPSEVRGNDIFDFLNDHIDMEFTDVNAEKMLGTKAGEEKAENIWNLFSPYVSLAQAAFKAVDELTDDILLEAMRNSYLLGMLVAITNSTTKKNTQGNHEKLDKELSDLSKKEKPDDTSPQPSAMCYSPRY